MSCEQIITSEDTYELLVPADREPLENVLPDCTVKVDGRFSVWYYKRDRVPELSVQKYLYSAIPKCYGLLSAASLEESGIARLQSLPTLSLTGQGVLITIIDTGIAYEDDAFRNPDGSTRIVAMWDQTAGGTADPDGTERENAPDFMDRTGSTQPGEAYGRVYTKEMIDEALRSENPREIVPESDTNGHGTLLASIAAGSRDENTEFTGAAPQAELVVVKLKKAKQYLKDFFFIPDSTEVYAESDIMTGISFAHRIATQQNRGLVIMIGLGTNNGSHSGSGPLCEYIDSIGILRHRAVAVAAGNAANMRCHFYGRAESVLMPQKVEINVERDMPGFYVELWGLAPERFSVSVQSPTGEILSRPNVSLTNQQITFLFEGTRLTVDYQDAGRARRDLLIFLHFTNAVKGVWTVNVYPENAVTGYFHMWLPMQGMLNGPVYFLRPEPDVTITSPSDAEVPMTVGGYNVDTGALYLDSGRGFDSDGEVKPDFLAPAVEIVGKGLRNNYVTATGTSAATALTAGACAQILEWSITRGNAIGINSVDIKNFLIRGATRSSDQVYPSTSYGYGKLQVYDSFEEIRGK